TYRELILVTEAGDPDVIRSVRRHARADRLRSIGLHQYVSTTMAPSPVHGGPRILLRCQLLVMAAYGLELPDPMSRRPRYHQESHADWLSYFLLVSNYSCTHVFGSCCDLFPTT